MAAVEIRLVTRSFGKGAGLLVIEDIPLVACPHCGASHFTARTLHEIERIKALRGSITVSREVAVASFPAEGA
jgi:YgiT-type zinc finger domain-containing protein